MLRCVTVRELSHGKPFCQFCHFLIYNSVRFIYISVTFSFTCFFLFRLAKIPAMPFCLAICVMSGKSLFLNGFFLPKRLPKPAINAAKKSSH